MHRRVPGISEEESFTLRTRIEAFKSRRDAGKFSPSQAPPKSGMDRNTILTRIADVPFWWHYIELGYGIVTPGHQGGVGKPWATWDVLQTLHMPSDLSGKTVLDVGAWDGYFSFEAEKRGALRVLAIDNFYRLEKEGKHYESGTRGFEVAKEILASNVQYRRMDVLDLCPKVGAFDIVMFPGVFYHLRHPLLALERIASVTRELMIMETYYETRWRRDPVAIFYEHELHGDPTVWWAANQLCLEALVRSSGFARVKTVHKTADRIVLHALKRTE